MFDAHNRRSRTVQHPQQVRLAPFGNLRQIEMLASKWYALHQHCARKTPSLWFKKQQNPHRWGVFGGRNRTRTCDLLCVSDNDGMSIMSIPYIWWYQVDAITIRGSKCVHSVHIFHGVLLALQMVANGLIKVRPNYALSTDGQGANCTNMGV
jgi:hypothetical protein